MNERLKLLANRWREGAKTLRNEVERGIALRQSAEEKLARAEVLEACANQLEHILSTRDP